MHLRYKISIEFRDRNH